MKRALYLLACLPVLAACAGPVTTSQKTVSMEGNSLQVNSGTVNGGRFILVANAQKVWEASLKGGKEEWGARRDFLYTNARNEIERLCGQWGFAQRLGPVYNMLDNDETMGGTAPVLGIAVSMAAYLAAAAATQDTNVPASIYMEFSCPHDEK